MLMHEYIEVRAFIRDKYVVKAHGCVVGRGPIDKDEATSIFVCVFLANRQPGPCSIGTKCMRQYRRKRKEN